MHKRKPQGKAGWPNQCSSAWGSWNLASGKGAAGVRTLMWLFLSSRLLGNFSLKLNDCHVFCNECTVLLLLVFISEKQLVTFTSFESGGVTEGMLTEASATSR